LGFARAIDSQTNIALLSLFPRTHTSAIQSCGPASRCGAMEEQMRGGSCEVWEA